MIGFLHVAILIIGLFAIVTTRVFVKNVQSQQKIENTVEDIVEDITGIDLDTID